MSELDEAEVKMSDRILSKMVSSANMFKYPFDFGGNSSQQSLEARFKKMSDSLTEKVENDADEAGKGLIETVRLTIKYYRDQTLMGSIYTQFMVVINVMSCFQYIYLTYTDVDNNRQSDLYLAFFFTAFGIGCLFLFDWVLSLLCADNIIHFMGSFHCWVDIMTFVPVFATYNTDCPNYTQMNTPKEVIFYILCGMTTTRILRSLRFHKYFNAIEDEVQRFLAEMGLKIVVMILFSKLNSSSLWNFYSVCTVLLL